MKKDERERLTKRLRGAYALIAKGKPLNAGYEIRDLIRKVEAGEL